MARRCNYIKTCRKACALTQEETAYLLGLSNHSAVSKLEYGRYPDHVTTVAYLALLNAPARVLFAGTFASVERRVKKRLRTLVRKLHGELKKDPNDSQLQRKIEKLEELLSGKLCHALIDEETTPKR